jgi:hypothetical protein
VNMEYCWMIGMIVGVITDVMRSVGVDMTEFIIH